MGLTCGQSVDVTDINGAFYVRFIAQCGGRFLVISHDWGKRAGCNGLMLSDWRTVLRELVALAVPESLRHEKGLQARSLAVGRYSDLNLSYPLSIQGLADLFDESADVVRTLLADLAVQAQ